MIRRSGLIHIAGYKIVISSPVMTVPWLAPRSTPSCGDRACKGPRTSGKGIFGKYIYFFSIPPLLTVLRYFDGPQVSTRHWVMK